MPPTTNSLSPELFEERIKIDMSLFFTGFIFFHGICVALSGNWVHAHQPHHSKPEPATSVFDCLLSS
jgi:hypothetical protein